ncbi:MAG: hypothetical protein J6R06_08320 [Bacteroidales bacterium]|nr:hypothetical protein [Bacteroidales bacterium]
MALFENFPYTDLHQLNMDWIIKQFKALEQSTVLSVNGQTGAVVLYQAKKVEFPDVPEDNWSIVRLTDGTTRGIYFGSDNNAYIVHGNDLSALYSSDNPPPYPVTSVNGGTGNITLYEEAHIELPSLTDAQLHNWNIFRELNNVMRGIQFEDTGVLKIIDGLNRHTVYSSNNPPPYPVTSVNGKTGNITLFVDSNGDISFPDFDDENISGWMFARSINNINCGIQINTDGTIDLLIGEDVYKIYSSNDPQPGFVTDSEAAIMQTREDTTGYIWGLIRNTDNGAVGIVFNNTDNTDPDAFIRYKDNNDQWQNLRLLTEGDIPSTGVYSINGQAGVVTLYGADIHMSASDSRNIPQAIEDVKKFVAIVENGDIATNNIAENDYVIWKNNLYRASTSIIIGDVLSLSNLTPTTNNIFSEIEKINNKLKLITITDVAFANLIFDSIESGITLSRLHVVKTEFIIDFYMQFSYNQAISVGSTGNVANIKIATFGLNYEPASYYGCKLSGFDDTYKPEIINYGTSLYIGAFRASENGYTIPANTQFAVQGTYITDH